MLYLNGQIIETHKAIVSPYDRGFLLGDGLFETLRCYRGNPFAIEAHWQRLMLGAQFLQIPVPINKEEFKQVIKRLLTANDLDSDDASIRFTLTRGEGLRGVTSPHSPIPTTLITCTSINTGELPPATITVTQYTRNEKSPLSRFKTLGYLENIAARQQANINGFVEALLLNTRGTIASTTAANIFMVKNNKLYTPSINCGALPGITRDVVLKLAKQLSVVGEEKDITIDELKSADEVFLTNSIIEIRPVKRIDEIYLNENHSGSITKKIKNAFDKCTLERGLSRESAPVFGKTPCARIAVPSKDV